MAETKIASRFTPASDTSPNAEPSQTSGVLTTVVRGTIWSVVASGATAITSFLITPFTIRLFGPEEYGMWAILTTIVGYFGFADLGMGTASTRFATEAHHQGDAQREADVIWTSLLIGFASAAIFAVLLALSAGKIISGLVNGSPHLQIQGTFALRLVG